MVTGRQIGATILNGAACVISVYSTYQGIIHGEDPTESIANAAFPASMAALTGREAILKYIHAGSTEPMTDARYKGAKFGLISAAYNKGVITIAGAIAAGGELIEPATALWMGVVAPLGLSTIDDLLGLPIIGKAHKIWKAQTS